MDIKEILPEVKENVSLAEHTTIRIGGKARYFFIAENKEELIKAIKTAKELKSAAKKSKVTTEKGKGTGDGSSRSKRKNRRRGR